MQRQWGAPVKCGVTILACWLGVAAGTARAAAGNEEELFRELGVVRIVLPDFPHSLRSDGVVVGTASVILTRGADGLPIDVLVVGASHPKFGQAVAAAAREWRFAPVGPGERRVQRTPVLTFQFTARGVILVPMGRQSTTEGWTFGAPERRAAGIVAFEQLDSVPRAIAQAMPVFPRVLTGRVERGWAEVEFLVDEDGRVRVPVVRRESAPEFGDAALAAVSGWRFTEPRRHGRRIAAAAGWGFQFAPVAPESGKAK